MAPSTTTRRLLKEVAELSSSTANPTPTFYAAPVSDSDLHEWHFTLLGPPSPSPYAGGMYHGRISLPPQYPLKPPNFRFLTPSGRFEVNREICLSISGFHEETWMPAWGIRTALTALRSFMAEKGTAGQVGGLEATDEVRKRLAKQSKAWRCGDCAQTNEEVMRVWWGYCKEAGVKVDEEGFDMGLEALPEGMNVSAFDRSQSKNQDQAANGADATVATAQPDKMTEADVSCESVKPPSHKTNSGGSDGNTPKISREITMSNPGSRTNNPEQSSEASRFATTTPPSRPATGLQARTAVSQQHAPMATNNHHHITLDRAIYAVFLALCFMVVKKLFFSTTATGSRYGSNDDWEIGLSRDY